MYWRPYILFQIFSFSCKHYFQAECMTDNRHIFHRHASGDQAAGLNLTSAYQTVVVNTASMARATTTLLRWRGSSGGRGRGWRGRRARPRAWCPRMRPPPPPGLTPGTSPSSRSSQSSLTSGTKQQVGDFYLTSLIFRWGWHNNFDFDCDTLCRNIEFPKINIIH